MTRYYGVHTYVGNHDAASHIHKLQAIVEPPYKYRCIECGTRLQRKSGVMVKRAPQKDDKK